jgi:hypothetical protein
MVARTKAQPQVFSLFFVFVMVVTIQVWARVHFLDLSPSLGFFLIFLFLELFVKLLLTRRIVSLWLQELKLGLEFILDLNPSSGFFVVFCFLSSLPIYFQCQK